MADKIGLPPEQVFKTLVARGDRHGVCFAVVPGNCRLDLKALAKLTGDRKVETVPLKEVQPLTGYVRGGVTVLGAKKAYPVYVDETIELFEVVSVSAGMRGLQILLAPADYLRATGADSGRLPRWSDGGLAQGVRPVPLQPWQISRQCNDFVPPAAPRFPSPMRLSVAFSPGDTAQTPFAAHKSRRRASTAGPGV